METAVLILIALCGFLAGAAARINVCSVPQRGPNLFWGGIALFIYGLALWGGIETRFFANLFWFFSAVVAGAALAWLFRRGTPRISD